MRLCPKCGSSYTDDTLVFCLQDGATLQSTSEQSNPLSLVATLHDDTPLDEATAQNSRRSSAPTVEIPQSALHTRLYEEARPTARATSDNTPAAPTQAINTGRVIVTTVLVTVLLLGLGGYGAWLFFRGRGDGLGRERRTGQPNSNSALPANSSGAQTGQNTPGTNNQARGEDRPDKGGRWFVVLASFQRDERASALERLETIRRQGFDARVESSNDYPNFKGDLWLVLMGPFTRNRAEEVLAEVRPKVKDAYAKSGW